MCGWVCVCVQASQMSTKLSSLGRGPFQTAGIHDFITVGPFGLFGYPFINKILWGVGKKEIEKQCKLKASGKLLTEDRIDLIVTETLPKSR